MLMYIALVAAVANALLSPFLYPQLPVTSIILMAGGWFVAAMMFASRIWGF
jgi:hypothetical protein